MPTSQVFTLEQNTYQIFFEMTNRDSDKNKHNSINDIMTKINPHGLHDYYCTFLNKRIFNTRYINYDPYEHKFKNHVVKNQKQNHNILGFNLNVNLSKLSGIKIMKKM
jgi:methyl coenzyme M reductase subunit D